MFDIFKNLNKIDVHPTGPIDYLIVGLGNPGYKYENTRHNAGFKAVDFIASDFNKKYQSKFNALVLDTVISEKRVLILKPQILMNLSGQSVKEAMNFYKINSNHVLIIFDDISLPVGKIRIRQKGSDGGHNGMKNIINLTGKNDFPRIKIGVGSKPNLGWDLADWVLSEFKEDEKELLNKSITNTYGAIKILLKNNIQQAMNKYNG